MSDSQVKVLVVDDESSLRRALSLTLPAMGFMVSTEPTGEQAIESLRKEPFDAVLLDLYMPGIGGMATCRIMRQQHKQLGILMLTLRQHRKDKVEALEADADDYIVKPFDLSELAARLRAVVRRARSSAPAEAAPIRIGDLALNRQNRSLTKSGQLVPLTPNEFALLECLMSQAGRLVPHRDVFHAVSRRGGRSQKTAQPGASASEEN